jgi:hypothetical protein
MLNKQFSLFNFQVAEKAGKSEELQRELEKLFIRENRR